jgi:CubicO group peptidase (beta-lactamase class C family)
MGADDSESPNLLDKLSLAMATKRLCSAIYVSEREEAEACKNSATTFLGSKARRAMDAGALRIEIDRERRMATGTWESIETRAKFFDDQGCVILPEGSEGVFFTPCVVESTLAPADSLPWPIGDLPSESSPPADIDADKVEQAVAMAFSSPDDCTAAYLAVHRGQIIAEQYGPGVHKDMQLESWSMGKSITATLVGILMRDGHFRLDDPAPVPQWQNSLADPRAEIRIMDLLRMSSGLLFTHASEDAERRRLSFVPGHGDHSLGYAAPIDVFQFSESRPAEHPPNTVGRYRNCDPLVLGSIVKRTVEAKGDVYLTWPQKALFDRIGIRRQVLETDPFGNFILTGFDFGTARNWARLGLLYLQDGVLNGERILPEGFVDFVSAPAPAWDNGEYGGQFWIGHPALPQGAYCMRGVDGQEVAIVPSHDLVLVRMGHTRGGSVFAERRNRAHELIVQAIDPRWSASPARS